MFSPAGKVATGEDSTSNERGRGSLPPRSANRKNIYQRGNIIGNQTFNPKLGHSSQKRSIEQLQQRSANDIQINSS